MRRSLRCLSSVVLLALISTGCAGRKSVLTEAPEPKPHSHASTGNRSELEALVARARAHWRRRLDPAACDAAIAAWKRAAKQAPERADLELRLAYAYHFKARAHLLPQGDHEAMKACYDEGIRAAERALRLLSPDFAAAIQKGTPWAEALALVDRKAAPALYWYAVNLGKWALEEGFVATLKYKDRTAAVMERCLELDETLWYGGPHRYFGVYRTKIPFPGGDLEASRKHFERALRIAPEYLETRVLYAAEYATKANDEALYRRLLGEVLATPSDIAPALVPENTVAKRRARALLEQIEDHF